MHRIYISISVDCGWAKWSPYSECDSVCGPGSETAKREVRWRPYKDGKKCLIADRTRSRMCMADTNCTTSTIVTRPTTPPYASR